MDRNTKLIKAGFTVIRRFEYGPILIKKAIIKQGNYIAWVTLEKDFPSRAALNRRMKELLKDQYTVED